MLRARQQRFVDEYMVDLNATRAAIAAGYTKHTASQAGWEVLRNPKVAAEVSRRQRERAQRQEISAERVVEELAKLAFANLGDFYTVNPDGVVELDIEALSDPAKAAAVTQIEITERVDGARVTKVKLADKRAALVDLGKHLGLFVQEALPVIPEASSAVDGDPDIRQLALAALALLHEASEKSREPAAKLLPMRRRHGDDRFEIEL